jgi:hypothetical protein
MRSRMHSVFVAFSLAASMVARAQPVSWVPLDTNVRARPGMAFDSTRNVTVLFGGTDGAVGDPWEWDGYRWRARSSSGPGARLDPALAYDSQRHVTVLFGGRNSSSSSYYGDTWEWDGTSWSLRSTTGPSPRASAIAYDSQRGVAVLFGGKTASSELADTWEWNGVVWSLRTTSGPLARSGHVLAYDSHRGVTVLVGSANYTDTWEWNGNAWVFKTWNSPGRYKAGASFDSQRNVTVLFGGGGDPSSSTYYYDTWEWDGLVWVQRATDGPVARRGQAMAYDSRRHMTVLSGGATAQAYGDTWEWNGSVWSQRMATGPYPVAYGGLAYDARRRTSLFFGGYYTDFGGFAHSVGDIWEWNGLGWTYKGADIPTWGHTLTFDAERGVIVLFGGSTPSPSGITWTWSGSQWIPVSGSGPSARYSHAAVFDTVRRVIVLFGGVGSSITGDTWEWNGTGWMLRSSIGPPARYAHAMSFDEQRGIAVLFGGQTSTTVLGDTWEWDGSVWSQQPATGPSPRVYASLVYDPARRTTVLFGGSSTSAGGTFSNDTWEWNGVNWSQRIGTPPSARRGASTTFDSLRGVVLLLGGQANSGYVAGTWELDAGCVEPPTPGLLTSQGACPGGIGAAALEAHGVGPIEYRWQIRSAPELWSYLSDQPVPLACGGFATATPPDVPEPQISVTSCPGVSSYQLRCIVSNACGSTISSEITYTVCYPNCDCSIAVPILNVLDFSCFLQRFANGDLYANCDASTAPPVLNVQDFSCFLQKFATGCP